MGYAGAAGERDTMKLLDDLIRELDDAEVTDIRVGINWTAVSSRYCGLARTIMMPHGFRMRDAGDLTSCTALELAELAGSWNLTEASIGVAAINSLIKPMGQEINIFDYIYEKIDADSKVAVIGHFPDKNINMLREKTEVRVFERNPSMGDFIDTAEEYLLPEADVVLITGTAMINKSLQRLLELSGDAYTVVLGPSTPMSEVLFSHGVDVLAGSEIMDRDRILRKVSEGAHLFDLRDDLRFLVEERR